jgi:ubiquitin carboxyl-terminal hydrolase 36/42
MLIYHFFLYLFRQEDAHEFLRCLLSACQRSTKNDDYENETNRLQSYPFSLFSGSLCSKVECQKCGNLSIKNDPVEDLELEITNSTSLESALEDFCRKEILEDDNAYACEKCNCKTTAYRQILLSKIPNVLSIQLKRFCYSYNERPRKLNHFVEYPEYLQLNSFIYKNSYNNGISTRQRSSFKSKNNDILRLFSVIVHIGKSIGNGHYIAYIRSGEKWYRTSDEKVNICTIQEVLSQNSYLLFYSNYQYQSPPSSNEIVTNFNATSINNSHPNRVYNVNHSNKSVVNSSPRHSPEFDNRQKRKFILRSKTIHQSTKNDHLKNMDDTDSDTDHLSDVNEFEINNKKKKRKIITIKTKKVVQNLNDYDVTSNEDDEEDDNDNEDYIKSKRSKLGNIIKPSIIEKDNKDNSIPTSYFNSGWTSSALNIKKIGNKVRKNVRNVFGFKKKKITNPNVVSPMKCEKNDDKVNKNRNISDFTNSDNDKSVSYFASNINSFFNFLLFEKK